MVENKVVGSNKTVIDITEEDKVKYKDKIKVFIAEPSHGLINYMAHDNRINFYSHIAKLEATTNYKFFTGTVGRLMVSYARDIICTRALAAGMDYILWIDDDMMIPFNVFDRLIMHHVDMVMPLTFMRIPPYQPVMWDDYIEKGELRFRNLTKYPKDTLFPASEIGFGVVLMKVDILNKIQAPYFLMNSSIGEDIHFCYRLKEKGIQCWVDTSFGVGHIGTAPIITERQYLEYKEKGTVTHDNVLDYGIQGNL